ncbi:BtpA/SgcQ family protein [Salinarimonas rosea]|uniref:BtpA/SgcQ family protein n=1 Tax=Salinarimonas rosea TaxID=552063 RepID=UPI00048C0CCC|nr:BtpA/SgcQ family protein [Salinarimonas rosea]
MQIVSAMGQGAIKEIFGQEKALIGMIHCPPFPGAPRYRGAPVDALYDACMRDADALVGGGLDGLIVENHGDIPFSKPDEIGPETAAFMGVVTDRIARACGVPLGVNVLANAPIHAFAVAMAGGARFIRVNQWANAYVANEGFMEGRAAAAMRYRSLLRAEHVKVFADSHVKHGAHAITADRTIQELTRDLAFFDADAVIATGQRTGNAASLSEIEEIGAATHLPLLVGSGVSATNVAEILARTSGVIVASSLKQDGVWWNPVDPARVAAFVEAARPALGR